LDREHGVRLRQSYLRIAKQAAMMAGRYAHANSSSAIGAIAQLARLGRLLTRDTRRMIAGQDKPEAAFEQSLSRAAQIRSKSSASAHTSSIPAARSSGPVSTMCIAVTKRQTRDGSSSRARSVASSE
jgi:hypothetical protein